MVLSQRRWVLQGRKCSWSECPITTLIVHPKRTVVGWPTTGLSLRSRDNSHGRPTIDVVGHGPECFHSSCADKYYEGLVGPSLTQEVSQMRYRNIGQLIIRPTAWRRGVWWCPVCRHVCHDLPAALHRHPA